MKTNKLLKKCEEWNSKNKIAKWIINKLILFIVFTGLLYGIYLFLNYIKEDLTYTLPESEWWTGLGILITLTLAILLLNFVREREERQRDENTQNFTKQIEAHNSQFAWLKDLSTVYSLTLDLSTEVDPRKQRWPESIGKIKNLYEADYIKDQDLYRISVQIWKQDDVDSCFRIRSIAYNHNKKRLGNVLNYLSVLCFVDFKNGDLKNDKSHAKALYFNKKQFLNEIGFKFRENNEICVDDFLNNFEIEKNNDEIYAYSIVARYLYKIKMYRQSLFLFNLARKKSKQYGLYIRWHHRFILMILLNEDQDELKNMIDEFENEVEWKGDFMYFEFLKLFRDIKSIIDQDKLESNRVMNLFKSETLKGYDKFSMWNFSSIIDGLDVSDSKKDSIRTVYRNFYLFFGTDDEDILIGIEKNVAKQNYIDELLNSRLHSSKIP